MALAEIIREKLQRSFQLYDDLVAGLSDEDLQRKLPGIRSNTLAGQLWCVVGARESYTRGIAAGEWQGFSCSLDSAGAASTAAIREALRDSAVANIALLRDLDAFDDARSGLLLDLLEHEAAHQGQLIRYLYGLELAIPERWKTRYALE